MTLMEPIGDDLTWLWAHSGPLTRADRDRLPDDTVMQPDILVARREDFTERDLPTAPLLAVEVLSPSTRRFDTMVKWSRYEAAGCPSYWVVDPDTPTLIVWEMQDGAYAQVAKVSGDEVAQLTSPYDVEVVPADLIV